ncbi:MAG: MFS transporter [Rhodobiaceae bacterium]|nr:MFS transporter [Rhodobiaceae bacterium]
MTSAGSASAPRQWPVVSALGVVMIFTWGSTYYLMAVLAKPIAADTGWGLGGVTGALSAGLLTAGLASPTIGSRIARHGGRPVLAFGCGLIALGLTIIAAAQALWIFWAGWFVLGLGMAAGLYDPAFSTLGRIYGRDARRAITLLTLWGGFASTVCWPLSAAMLEAWGWRGTALGYAAIHVLVTAPLVVFAIPNARVESAAGTRPPPGAMRFAPTERLSFALIVAMLVLHGLVVVNISVWLFAVLQAQGYSLSVAVTIGTLLGPAQVAARILELANRERHHPMWTLSGAMLLVAVALIVLALDVGLAALAIILFGAGNGLFSIARGSLPLALFGEDRYATIIGRLGRPWMIAQAAAPTLGALLIASLGTEATLVTVAILAVLNIGLLFALWRATARLR